MFKTGVWIIDAYGCSKILSKFATRSIDIDLFPLREIADKLIERLKPSNQVSEAIIFIDNIIGKFMDYRQEYRQDKMVLLLVSEYGLVPVKNVVYPNILLRDNGLLKVREIAGREYIDYELSSAFAVIDHQIAHIYCKKIKLDTVKNVLKKEKNIHLT